MEVVKHSKSKQGTPVKDPGGGAISRSRTPKNPKVSENLNPNTSCSNSPLTKYSKSQKDCSKNPVVFSPRTKLGERKFVVAKKKSKKERSAPASDPDPNVKIDCKCKEKFGGSLKKKCLCVAYENLRSSQEDFFKNKSEAEVEEKDDLIDTQEEKSSVPESGKVMNLVKAFEKLLSTPNSKESEDGDGEKEPKEDKNDNNKKPLKWALSDCVLTAENLGFDRRCSVSSSWDGSQGRSSNGGRRSQGNSSESHRTIGGRRWKKQVKPTSQKPFKLRTEQRGKVKEEEFMKKIQEMKVEEEKQRVPIAQGLPWTTDEPEVLIKPYVKENTRPVDPRLCSDIRASERSEFDHQVAEKMSLIEQYKMERAMQDKTAEEEEIKRLRKELVPKAQPMPFFDRPFLPRRSSKNPTIPKEPQFHMPQHKRTKC